VVQTRLRAISRSLRASRPIVYMLWCTRLQMRYMHGEQLSCGSGSFVISPHTLLHLLRSSAFALRDPNGATLPTLF
jgi:hypothetical protein